MLRWVVHQSRGPELHVRKVWNSGFASWQTRCDVSWIVWIDLTYPSGEEPVECVCQESGNFRPFGKPSVWSHIKTNQICYCACCQLEASYWWMPSPHLLSLWRAITHECVRVKSGQSQMGVKQKLLSTENTFSGLSHILSQWKNVIYF